MRKAKEILLIFLHSALAKHFLPNPAYLPAGITYCKYVRVGTKIQVPQTQKMRQLILMLVTHRISTQLVEPVPMMVLTFSGTAVKGNLLAG